MKRDCEYSCIFLSICKIYINKSLIKFEKIKRKKKMATQKKTTNENYHNPE